MKPSTSLAALLALGVLAGVASAQNAAAPNAAAPAPAKQQDAAKPKPPANNPPANGAAPAPAGKTDADGNVVQVDPAAALSARYARAAAVGDEHKWLAQLVGKWKTVTGAAVKPNTPLIEAQGTSEFKALMDGRFVIESNSSMGAQGPMQGMGIIGFNNLTQKYERVWFDTRSTAMCKSEGEFNKEREEIRWTDTWCDPASGVQQTTTSSLRRASDGKEFFFTQAVKLPNDQIMMVLTIKYRKAE